MLAPNRKRLLPLLVGLVLTLSFCFQYRNTDRIYIQWTPSTETQQTKLPANRTLGFGGAVVVSKEGSNRRHAFVQQANVTEFDVTIPKQPQWTESDVQKFRNSQEDDVQHGSILAWMGHLNVLQWFLDSGLETALVLEDDLDWDIRLRNIQIPLAANAARTLMPPKRSLRPPTRLPQNRTQYWGDHGAWDLLYLGHCGDYFNRVTYDGLVFDSKPFTLNDVPHLTYHDPTMPPRSELHPLTQHLFSILNIPEHGRTFHRSKFPLCSFAYAVTRPAAELLLTALAPPKLKPGGPRAFDVALLHACLKGARETNSITTRWANPASHPDRGLRCWTLNSELFHHVPGESEIAKIGKEHGEDIGQGLSPVDWAGQAQTILRNETTNIGCGFWSGAFAFKNGDTERLEFLREHVGREGKCLKEGRDAV
ncbi:hypothetical protein DPSP01_000791 [Paraphaeosphaeria sporulosa]|uniref:Glycosyltransferase family 25 protein n=1 Tax=Paraphaeosphaeria sporulosa TaxID=1460663 RepID=A0A177CPU6_9PLEO|nr:uncharacterized protein CC84DRAFT_1183853 [Paraphaeosphaeria sporulosa]OAG09544.1 hypothetical protein CC84DRAFT_1183853 [Paraphaeosphaeria sporulosa]